MSKDLIEREVKELYLRGPNTPLPTKIEALLKNRDDCLIIGDGKNPIDPDELKKILKEKNLKITSNTRIDICGHGNRYDDIEETIDEQGNKALTRGEYHGQHVINLFKDAITTISSFDILQEIAGTNTPLYIHLWSCYGGSANKATKFLPPKSILVTHIEAKELESISLAQYSANASLERYLDLKNNKLTPYQQFILDIQENFEAATFNQATKDGPIKFKFTRIPKEKYMADVLQQIDEHPTIDGFVKNFFAKEVERFKNDFPNENLEDAINAVSNVDKQTAEKFAQGVLVHAFRVEKQNSLEQTKRLLEKLQNKEININESPDNNIPPLQCAVYQNSSDRVKLLLEHRVDLNIKNNGGLTALHVAASENHPDILKQLIEAGADLNIKNNDGHTALYYAASENHPDILKQLIEAGADLNIQDNDGYTALYVAASANHPDILKQLIEAGADLNIQDNDGHTVLHVAASENHPDILKSLIEAGADLNIQDNDGYTALHVAASGNHPDILKQLIEAGADLNIQDNDGYTTLCYAAAKNHPDILKQLIEAGADLNIQDNDGYTALCYAASDENHSDILKQLIKAGANLNIQDNNGYTALHWAVSQNHPDILKSLIEAGADLNIEDLNGQTPLNIAIADNNIIIQILNEAIEKQNKKAPESLQETKKTDNNKDITIPKDANKISELSEETNEKDTKVINKLANYLTQEIQEDEKITSTHKTEMKDTVEKLLSSVSDNNKNVKETSEAIVKESIQTTKEKLSFNERLAKIAKIISKHLSKVKRIKKILKNSGIIEKLKTNKKEQAKAKFSRNQPNKNDEIRR